MYHFKNLLKGVSYQKCSQAISNAIDSMGDKCFYSVNISNLMYEFRTLTNIFPDIGDEYVLYNIQGKNKVETRPAIMRPTSKQQQYFKLYKGTPIWLIHAPIVYNGPNRDDTVNEVLLRTINTKKHKKTLKEFVIRLMKYSNHLERKNWKDLNISCHEGSRNMFDAGYEIKRRNFDNVFLPNSDKELIKSSLDKFINNRDWYINNCLPYHFGILLYGEPGTAKTVTAQAIADYVGAKMVTMFGSDIEFLPEKIDLLRSRPSDDAYTVLVIEDVDCGLNDAGSDNKIEWKYGRGGKMEAFQKRTNSFAKILNCIDGIDAPDNMIYVLTTNHIEQLDPALIRPGRCDIRIEMKGVTDETFREFCMFHYKELPPRTVNISRNITFAELQTDVMRGYSINQLIEKLEGEDHYESFGNESYTGNTD